MKKTLTIYFLILSSLFLASCENPFVCVSPATSIDSFFEDVKNNTITSSLAAKCLIKKGADINYTDKDGNTLLHVVSSIEIAKLFLEQGLDKEAKNNRGKTSLYTAIERRHYDVALFLKQRGALDFTDTHDREGSSSSLVVQHLRERNLNPEETKLLREINRLIRRDLIIREKNKSRKNNP